MQVGHCNFSAFLVARAKAESVFQTTLHDLIGHTDIHHVGQVVFGSRLCGGQTNGRCKCTHHRTHARFVELFNFSRTCLRGRLRIGQQRFDLGATERLDAAGFVDVFNRHQRTFTALLS